MRRQEWLVFGVLLVTYAYFFQGGGWNQNGRFDQVRAIVEQGSFAVNDFLLYTTGGTGELRRVPHVPGSSLSGDERSANTGDLARVGRVDERFYPNKPPGTVLLALPGYLVVHTIERLIGLDPDRWWVLNLNHYLTTLLSVGLIGALGGVLFLRTSRTLLPELPDWTHTASALTLGTGTILLPFSTMLFDHVEAGVLLLLSFYCLLRLEQVQEDEWAARRLGLVTGLAAGGSVIVSYLSAPVVALLLLYSLHKRGWSRALGWVVAGGLPAVVFLAAYHAVCFGSPLAVANTFQNEIFLEQGLTLGVFRAPRPDIALALLVGLRRGLFVTSPVLLAAFAGAFLLLRGRRRRAEIVLSLAVFVALWLINASFKEWHAGFSLGPRYLLPALPLVGLGLPAAFARLPRITLAGSVLSMALVLGATAVDAQPPPKFPRPLSQYYWPLVTAGSVTIETVPIEGRVSVNPIGTYDPWYYTHFPPGSPQARWSSFNLGELIWPRSPASLLPLLLFYAGCGLWYARRPRDAAAT